VLVTMLEGRVTHADERVVFERSAAQGAAR